MLPIFLRSESLTCFLATKAALQLLFNNNALACETVSDSDIVLIAVAALNWHDTSGGNPTMNVNLSYNSDATPALSARFWRSDRYMSAASPFHFFICRASYASTLLIEKASNIAFSIDGTFAFSFSSCANKPSTPILRGAEGAPLQRHHIWEALLLIGASPANQLCLLFHRKALSLLEFS